MSIGKKILSTVTHILIICILIFAIVFLSSFLGFKYQVQKQSDVLKNTTINKVQDSYETFSETLLYDYTSLFVEQSNYKFNLLENRLTDTSSFASDLYDRKTAYSIGDDYMLLPSVSFSDIETELSYVYPLEFLLSQHDSSLFKDSKIYYCSESGFILNPPFKEGSITLESNVHDRPWYSLCKSTNDVVWSDPYYDLITGLLTISCSKGVFDENGTFLGTIAVDFSENSLVDKRIFENLESSNSSINNSAFSNYFILNSSGQIILSSSEKSDYDDNVISTCLSGKNAVDIYLIDNTIVSCADFGIKDWKICFLIDSSFISSYLNYIHSSLNESTKIIDENLQNLFFVFWISIVVTVILMLIVAVFFSRRLAKSITVPLDKLSSGIKLIGTGELEHKIVVDSNTELSELANVINDVSSSLKESILKVMVESAQNQQMLSELELGKAVQVRMLPEKIDCENIDISAFMQPARYIGGDFYDYFYINEHRLAFVVGDVSGKGVAAALFMSYIKGIIKLLSKDMDSPSEVLKKANNDILDRNYDCTFVTAVLGFIDTETFELNYCVAGHLPPLLKRDEQVLRIPIIKSLPLGIVPSFEYKTLNIKLKENDNVILYTDGISDTSSLSGDSFGEKSIIDCLKQKNFTSAEEICSYILYKSISFSEGQEQFDDMTLAVLRIRNTHFHENISNNLEELAMLLDRIENFLKKRAIDTSYYIMLVVEELITNIIKHGTKDKCNVELWIEMFPDNTKITIIDESFEFNPNTIENPDVNLSVDKRKVGGLGIYLIRKLSKEMKYKRIDNKNVNTIIV